MYMIREYLKLVILWTVIAIELVVVHMMNYPGIGYFLLGFSLAIVVIMTIQRLKE